MKTAGWLPHVLSATVLTAAVSLCVVGCGEERSDSPDTRASASASADGSLHPGTFRANLPGGASVRITLPAPDVPDQRIDRLRQDAKVARATYATVEIDNEHGASPVSVSRLVLRAKDGASYQLEHVSRATEKWMPRVRDEEYHARDGSTLPQETAEKLRMRLRDAAASATKDIPVGERGSNLLVGDISAVPDSFVSLELIPQIGDREVTPVKAHPDGGEGSSDAPGTSGSSRVDGADEAEDAPAPDSTELPVDPGAAEDPKDPVPSSQPSAANPPVDPVDPNPVDPGPVDPNPVDPGPVDPNPVDPGPVDPNPVDPDPELSQPTVPDPPNPGALDPQTPAPVDTDAAVTDPVATAPEQPEPVPTGTQIASGALRPADPSGATGEFAASSPQGRVVDVG
ncbi:hypothetical protein [Kocuria salsicia]|uniref:hypothetical protein n=1 Tax=Kocuria salsicia TaxID=664639 RepID=UPI0011A9E9A4|nr:hypothetical protein [Kocuria salsicia]